MGKERRGRRRGGKVDEGGEKEGLPPLEWRSGYAPGMDQYCICYSMYFSYCTHGCVCQLVIKENDDDDDNDDLSHCYSIAWDRL